MLIAVCEAPGLSRYNPIEHLWSPCSKFLAGVQLSPHLPDESVAPASQNIPAEEKAEKEKVVFSNALDRLDQYWDGKIHDGFKITSKGMKPGEEDDISMDDYSAVQDMLGSSLRNIRENEDARKLLDEWKYYVRHMDRRRGLVCFRKGCCNDPECDCMDSAPVAVKVGKVPSGDKWLFPPINPDPEHPDHYQTFQQLLTALRYSEPDQHMKGGLKTQCHKCRYLLFTLKFLHA